MKLIGRFQFIATLAVATFMAACGWIKDVETIIPVVLKALSLLLAMIQEAGITVGSNVQSVIGQINTTAGEILAALKSGPLTGTILDQVITALNDFLTYFQNLINLLPPLPALVVDLVASGIEIILSTIQGYIENPPMPVAASVTKPALAKLATINGMKLQTRGGSPRTIQFSPVKRNGGQFRKGWNAISNMPTKYDL